MVKVPDRYLQETAKPEGAPQTFGEAVKSIPEWSYALGQCNADKAAARKYQEEMNNG